MRINQGKNRHLIIAAALGAGALLMAPQPASAVVSGQCANCHTMHNSQNNIPMNFNLSATPNDTLLRGNCIECHTGTNTGTLVGGGIIPYVYDDSAIPIYGTNTLAGGNFYWVAAAGGAVDADGHNVDMLNPTPDGDLTYPPGFDEASAWSTRVDAQTDMIGTANLTCAGTAGCHGDRTQTTNAAAVNGAHHTDDTGGITGTSVGLSFRFLKGILGTEINYATPADAWEYSNNPLGHNEYYGTDRANQGVDDTGTISSLCAQCHGGFHNNIGVANFTTAGIQGSGAVMTTPWVRHPTDYDMNNKGGTTEYAAYTVYDTNVPVGHHTLDGTTNDNVAYGNAGGAVVLCISCHRAHGSPYADLLRWDYSGMVAGNGGAATGTGCFKCHTTKD